MKKYLSLIFLSSFLFGCNNDTVSEIDESLSKKTNTVEESSSAMENERNRVIIIGIDGAGHNFDATHTPNISKIFTGDNVATTHDCLTSNPTISAQCWGSMLTGVVPTVHGFTNTVIGSTPNTTHPSIFKQAYDQMDNPVLASFVNWNSINIGIVEENIGVYKVHDSDDNKLADKICTYIAENDPDLLYVQFDSVDHAGHTYGFDTKKYYEALANVDDLVGTIFANVEFADRLDKTTFIVTADHGGSGTSHGGLTDAEKYIFFGIRGNNINKSTIKNMQVRDITSILAYCLGINENDAWDSYIPKSLFKDNMNPIGREVVVVDPKEVLDTPLITGKDGLYSFVNENDVTRALFFDNNYNDIKNNNVTTSGKNYFVDDAIFGKALNINGDGYIKLDNLSLNNSNDYTISSFVNLQSAIASGNDPVFFGNKDWDLGKNSGITVAFRPNDIKLSIGYNGESKVEEFYSYPDNYIGNWFHFLLSIDNQNKEVKCYINFTLVATTKITGNLTIAGDYPFTIGQDGKGTYPNKANFIIDDFMVFNKKFSKNEVASLKNYYESVISQN